jgi:hypothetical protein
VWLGGTIVIGSTLPLVERKLEPCQERPALVCSAEDLRDEATTMCEKRTRGQTIALRACVFPDVVPKGHCLLFAGPLVGIAVIPRL